MDSGYTREIKDTDTVTWQPPGGAGVAFARETCWEGGGEREKK